MLDTTKFEVHVTPRFYCIDPVAAAPSSSSSSSLPSGSATADPPHAAAAAAASAPEEVVWVNVPCLYTREIVVHAIARSVLSRLIRI